MKKLLMIYAVVGLILAVSGTASATVNWKSVDWDAYSGSTVEVVSGNLVVTDGWESESGGPYGAAAHYNTSAAFRAAAGQYVEASFIDTAVTATGIGLWVSRKAGKLTD